MANLPIAVVGMALRAPGAETPEQFWHNIQRGIDCLSRSTPSELEAAGVPEKRRSDPRYVAASPRIEDIEYFDAAFFDMAPSEAEGIDPAHRIFLECCWEAMERAGLPPGPKAPTTGVFAGVGTAPFFSYFTQSVVPATTDHRDPVFAIPARLGNFPDFLSSRVAFKLGLEGPAFAVQSACATSLVAIHLAKESIRRGECDVALAGGASVTALQGRGYLCGVDGMLSSTGAVRAFDADADGTVFGSGVAVVALQRLDHALADGSPIQAVILGSGVSNDGHPADKPSFVAPSSGGQTRAIERALADAEVSPATIGLVEAHGTGTRLGDPVEVASLTEVYNRATDERQYCALGSVKSNVGHLRQASGVMGLIKAVLALKERTLPPSIRFETPNPRIDFPNTPFFVPSQHRPWTSPSHPRRAAVSAFGFGGTNAHIVIEEPPEPTGTARASRPPLLTLSAQTQTALSRSITELSVFLEDHPDIAPADVGHTLRTGRAHLPERATLVLDDRVPPALQVAEQSRWFLASTPRKTAPTVFLYPGQGAQRPGMARGLYDCEPVFREVVDRCADALRPHLDIDVRDLLLAEPSDETRQVLRQTRNAQPALFVVEYALTRLLLDWGVEPTYLLGHSLGEYVAACVSGVLREPDALRLVAARGRLMQACAPGAMVAVFLSEEEVHSYLGDDLELAVINAPALIAVSGTFEAVDRLEARLTAEGIGHRRLQTSHAFHSFLMEPALGPFRDAFADVHLQAPTIPFVSNLTGDFITDEQATDPEYWVAHIRHAVRFSEGVACVAATGDPVFLEVGPGRALSALVSHHVDASSALPVFGVVPEGRPSDDRRSAIEAMGRLWALGTELDWERYASREPGRPVVLPTYPFQRSRIWLEAADAPDVPNTTHIYEVSWREAALEAESIAPQTATWLVFADRLGLGDALAEHLRDTGARVVLVDEGDRFGADGSDRFRVRPGRKEDLVALVRALGSESLQPFRVVNLWLTTGEAGEHNSVAAFERALKRGFYAPLFTVQALFEQGLAEGLKLLMVADRVQLFDGDGAELHAEKAVIQGPCRAIPSEVPDVAMSAVDIPIDPGNAPPDWLLDALVAEACDNASERGVVLRRAGRFIEAFAPRAIPTLGPSRLRERGVVFITGGVGGLGLLLAESLFRQARARLALLTRWEPPPREEWAERSLVKDKVGRALRTILELEANGAEVALLVADANDRVALAAAVEQARSRFGAIHGVVHAAGASPTGPAMSKSVADCDPMFDAKARGAFLLEELFADTPLDIFIYYSSQAAYMPGPGRIDYIAANAVLDSLARRAATSARFTCAIGWGSWLEVGMAAEGLEWQVLRTGELDSGADMADGDSVIAAVGHPLVQYRQRLVDGRWVYGARLVPKDEWVLDGHRLDGRALMPGVGIVEAVRAAFIDVLGHPKPIEIADIAFLRPLFVEEEGRTLAIGFTDDGDERRFEVRSRGDGQDGWTVHATGRAGVLAADPPPGSPIELGAPEDHTPIDDFALIQFGARWACLEQAEDDETSTRFRLRLKSRFTKDLTHFGLHPALLDVALGRPSRRFAPHSIPFAIGSVRIFGALPAEILGRGQRRRTAGGDLYDIRVTDTAGATLVEARGFARRELATSGESLAVGDTATHSRGPARIHIVEPGNLSSLSWQGATPPAQPPPGHIRVDVVSAGLNFRDVLSALGRMPGYPDGVGHIGNECAGLVGAVGAGVDRLQVGDPVVALARDSLATHVTVDARLAVHLPRNLSFDEAAGVPIAHLTADYALNHLARLAEGERVLIHSATGGVGLAAVALARAAGAEIFATAGTPERRDYLREMGITAVMDSRSLAYVDAVRDLTDGEGVDVVLNALAGDFIPASIGLLRPFGRFIEIGKRDIYEGMRLNLFPFHKNLAYFAFDLGLVMAERPDELNHAFRQLIARFEEGELLPSPTTVFGDDEVSRGFEYIARTEHIGKVVIRVGEQLGHGFEKARAFELRNERLREIYGRGIRPLDGLKVFRRLLAAPDTPNHLMVIPFEVDSDRRAKTMSERLTAGSRPRPKLETTYQAPEQPEDVQLVAIWEKVLGVTPIGIDDDFFNLGGNSITAIQVTYAAGRAFGLRLPATTLFQSSTVARLAEIVRALQQRSGADGVDELLGELGELQADEAAALLAQAEAAADL